MILYLRISLFSFFLLFALAGCSYKMQYAPMAKDGVDPLQAKKDSHECKIEAANYQNSLAGGGGGSVGVMNSNAATGIGTGVMMPGPGVRIKRAAIEQGGEFYIECMEIKGYQLTDRK